MSPGGVFGAVDSSGNSSGTTRKYGHILVLYKLPNFFMYIDLCDPSWQSTRDALIIAAHVISDLAFLVEVVAAGFLVGVICCGKYCKFISIILEVCFINANHANTRVSLY